MIKPKIKQLQAIAKALTRAVVTTSKNLALGKLRPENGETDLWERIKEIQQKYGIPMCLDVFPSIIKRMEEKPNIVLNVGNKGAIKVNLLFKPVYDWIEKFKMN